jgi:hypothetical protein
MTTNFELREQLEKLGESVEEFIDFADENISAEDLHEDGEYSFLVDESGISNTDLDNFLEILKRVVEFIEQLK